MLVLHNADLTLIHIWSSEHHHGVIPSRLRSKPGLARCSPPKRKKSLKFCRTKIDRTRPER